MKKHIFNWEYCECGCHSYECRVGNVTHTLFWDLKDGYYLDRHIHSGDLKFDSMKAAEEYLLNNMVHMENDLIRERDSLNRILRALKNRRKNEVSVNDPHGYGPLKTLFTKVY